MERSSFRNRFYLSTIGDDAYAQAKALNLGLEIAEFCTASNMDQDLPRRLDAIRDQSQGIQRFWFHAPFAELCPAAIDPRIRAVTVDRYRQSMDTALDLGIRRLVIHLGYVPQVYFPIWFTEQSVLFWKDFLRTCPGDLEIALENVMEPDPSMAVDIVRQVNDPRLGLCLDIGHANTRGSQLDPEKWIEPMAPWLRHTHIHNNRGDWDLHNSLGDGIIPMERILDRLLSLDVTFTLENMNCEKSIRWLAERGYLE